MDKTDTIKSTSKLSITYLVIAVCCTFVTVFGLQLFNRHLLMSYSLPMRMILMIITRWLLILGPGILMVVNKEKLGDIGFQKDKILKQIGIGIYLAFAMSLVLTVLPILLGFKDMTGSTTYTKAWQFTYQFVYDIIGVALTEEFIFRGYIFKKLLEIRNSRRFAILISSLLFGLFHIFNDNLIQVFMTAFLGFLFCMLREKIKGCTLLSLIIAHGIYDALIVLWVSIL
jgi:membrane protease YdiL (CAAX protease family)